MAVDKAALHDLTAGQAVTALEKILVGLQEGPQNELTGMEPDTAFNLGYETAIFDLRHLLGPSTREVGIILHGKEE